MQASVPQLPCPSAPALFSFSPLAHSASLSLCVWTTEKGRARLPPPARFIVHLQTVLQMPCTCSWVPSRPAGAAQPIAKLLRRERQRPDLQLLPPPPRSRDKVFQLRDAVHAADAEGPESGQRELRLGEASPAGDPTDTTLRVCLLVSPPHPDPSLDFRHFFTGSSPPHTESPNMSAPAAPPGALACHLCQFQKALKMQADLIHRSSAAGASGLASSFTLAFKVFSWPWLPAGSVVPYLVSALPAGHAQPSLLFSVVLLISR